MENKKILKKELKEQVAQTLTNSLSNLKLGMSEKTYTRNIKKATKLLIADFKVPKPAKKDKKPAPATQEMA